MRYATMCDAFQPWKHKHLAFQGVRAEDVEEQEIAAEGSVDAALRRRHEQQQLVFDALHDMLGVVAHASIDGASPPGNTRQRRVPPPQLSA